MVKRSKTNNTVESEGSRWDKQTTLQAGETFTNRWGRNFTIGTHLGKNRYPCYFGDYEVVSNSKEIFRGQIHHPLDPTVYGRGYVGFGVRGCTTDRKAYTVWQSMFKRVYGRLEQYKAYSHYTVDISWFNFQNFCEWFYENYIEGFELDKDIGNSILKRVEYSSKTCCFLPPEVNKLLQGITSSVYVRAFKYHYTAKHKYKGDLVLLENFKNECEAKEAVIRVRVNIINGILEDNNATSQTSNIIGLGNLIIQEIRYNGSGY